MKCFAWNKLTGEIREIPSMLTGFPGMEDYPGLPGEGWVYPSSFQKADGEVPRRVRMTRVGDVIVHTSFLGYGWGNPPHVFETMACNPTSWSEWQLRKATTEEALKDHELAVEGLRAGVTMDDLFGEDK